MKTKCTFFFMDIAVAYLAYYKLFIRAQHYLKKKKSCALIIFNQNNISHLQHHLFSDEWHEGWTTFQKMFHLDIEKTITTSASC